MAVELFFAQILTKVYAEHGDKSRYRLHHQRHGYQPSYGALLKRLCIDTNTKYFSLIQVNTCNTVCNTTRNDSTFLNFTHYTTVHKSPTIGIYMLKFLFHVSFNDLFYIPNCTV